jgi:hypothetical protein
VHLEEKVLCRSCAGQGYYRIKERLDYGELKKG